MRYRFIGMHQKTWPVTLMCGVLNASSSGYYDWIKRGPSRRTQANRALDERIQGIFAKHRQRYGAPRIVDELHDEGIACQRTAAPGVRDVTEHTVFDLVPLARAGWEMADRQTESQIVGRFLKRPFPQFRSIAVAAAAVRRDQQRLRSRVTLLAHLLPPSLDRGRRETRGVVIHAHTHPAFMARPVIHPVRNRLGHLRVREVVRADFFRPSASCTRVYDSRMGRNRATSAVRTPDLGERSA